MNTMLPFSIIMLVAGATLIVCSRRECETGRWTFGVALTVVGVSLTIHCLISF